ncbi:MAG: hypothetical protein NTAFB01_13340 [Nitrospira sp.]
MSERQVELCTESTCEQCAARFTPKNRNGLKVRFCQPKCSRDWHNAQRLKGAALLKVKPPRRRGASKHAEKVSPSVFLALVPVEERAELLQLAAQHLGITDRDRIEAALRRAGIPNYEATA